MLLWQDISLRYELRSHKVISLTNCSCLYHCIVSILENIVLVKLRREQVHMSDHFLTRNRSLLAVEWTMTGRSLLMYSCTLLMCLI